ncbi:hypothetical protein [Rhizohabitans arisaemae]|uniref:hypothetical protein n=1 Tax=Rhizohabitans arisaemae TaxID=2720610 RepID=UPI0024B253C9|nr:hypothetical protein [Rhizohabitans arisaemae]
MKRWITITAAAVLVPLGGTAYAAPPAPKPAASVTATPAPVAALDAQFAKSAGVRFSETVTSGFATKRGLKSQAVYKASGVVGLTKTGVSASDSTLAFDIPGSGKTTFRTILVDGTAYLRGSLFAELLPTNVEWVSTPVEGLSVNLWSNSAVDLLAPGTLKSLLAKAKFDKKTSSYSGTIPLGKALSPQANLPLTKSVLSTTKIDWKLWVGKDHLPKRLKTSMTLIVDKKLGNLVNTSDIHFRGWGTPVSITAPPAHLVSSIDDLAELPLPPGPLDRL